jgi:tRNA(Arg) A34 adenosine deaminase TadA
MTQHISKIRRAFLGVVGVVGLMAPSLAPRRGFAATDDVNPIEQPSGTGDTVFIERAFEMRRQAIGSGDQGYGAIVVKDGSIVGQSPSKVIVNTDPTAHAEMQAIRDAASRLDNRDLSGCTLYSSSRACPMCEAAAYWAGIERMVYGRAATDAGSPSLCG